ncbi:dihydrolipoamide acetyltransferase family protein [Nocardioides sp.]|uniref:dihydrolipoamide acetyltransferase family protein n=1 Tax=Nocardioides sp. TaxID=35761 RepID=UPI002ED591FF
MPRLLRMPGVSANATDAVLSDWLVAEAGEFSASDALATIETDKALVDVEADDSGVVLKTLVVPGTRVEVGAPIAVLGAPGERVDDLDALLRDLGVATPAPASNGRVFASPLARRMARDANIPIEEVPGTGPRQRVLRRDVESALAARASAASTSSVVEVRGAPAPSLETPDDGHPSYEDVPHSRVRRLTAERLVASKREAPHFYLRATVRAERLVALRAELNDALGEDGVKVSVNDLVVMAVAAAHRRVPELNVTWTDDAVRRWHSVDVAVAVATDRGLVTPVLRDVGNRSITSIAAAVRELAGQAREGRLRQEGLEGGSITVTNLGMYGVEEFAAIINPPHAAILAVGSVREEPVVEDGAVVPGSVMTLTLSVDHRPVDGVVAARWLAALTELLERPVRLLA